MKIGIITFHRAINFGAVLQAVALECVLQKLYAEDDIEMIDYRNPLTERIYRPNYISKKRLMKSVISMPLQYHTKKIKREKFLRFNEKYLKMSKRHFETMKQLEEAEKQYDCFITGSDQVWSMECTEFDEAYFLSFVKDNKKKNSYAASFGFNTIPLGYEEEYKKRLAGYNHVAVREDSGKKILEELLPDEYKNISVTLDPTLLLTKEEWGRFTKTIKKEKKYILLYAVRRPQFFDFARELGQKTGYEILYINDRKILGEKGIKYLQGIGPDEFLGLFQNAEYIITNSFHGTVFSILFQKEFWVETNSYGMNNNRAKSLIKRLGISGRDLSEKREWNTKINWEKVEQVLKENKQKSLEYLQQIKDGA